MARDGAVGLIWIRLIVGPIGTGPDPTVTLS